MINKEMAYQIFTLQLGEHLTIKTTNLGPELGPPQSHFITRVPGGWKWGDVFVPWSDEAMPADLKVEMEAGRLLVDDVIVSEHGFDGELAGPENDI